jgi:hypothetical protein
MTKIRKLKKIPVGGSSQSGLISPQKLYRVMIDREWYEGRFSKQWFGWQFDGYREGMQLNLIDEVYEVLPPPRTG